jgi:hypothetical protein
LIDVLIKAVEINDLSSVRYIAYALGQIGPKAYKAADLLVTALSKAIEINDFVSADYIAHALRAIGAKASDPLIDAALIRTTGFHFNFAKNLVEMGPIGSIYLLDNKPISEWITLGAKLYPADERKRRTFQPSTDPAALAEQVESAITERGQLQISVGFDIKDPRYINEPRFIALALYIASMRVKTGEDFYALSRLPERADGGSYGLVIRGMYVTKLNETNLDNSRLDYIRDVYPNSTLTQYIKMLSMLNLGMFLTVAERSYQYANNRPHPVLKSRHAAIIRRYEQFKRDLISTLRDFDRLKIPEDVQRLPGEEDTRHQERVEGLRRYDMDISLYPDRDWIEDLNAVNTKWPKLSPYLISTIEAMLLQRTIYQDEEECLGDRFIKAITALTFNAAMDIQDIVNAKAMPLSDIALGLEQDPFIDDNYPEYSDRYAEAMFKALRQGEVTEETLPNPDAVKNYQMKSSSSGIYLNIPEEIPKQDPVKLPEPVRKPIPRPVRPMPVPMPAPEKPIPIIKEPAKMSSAGRVDELFEDIVRRKPIMKPLVFIGVSPVVERYRNREIKQINSAA